MKAAVIFSFAVLLLAAFIDVSVSMQCRKEPQKCKEGECCVEFSIFSSCKPLLKEGERCELGALKSSFDNHIYMLRCPCDSRKNLVCEEDDSGSAVLGTCVQK